jgi:hypothetical protein
VVVLSLDNAMSMPAGRLSAAVGTGVLLSMIEEGKEIFGSRDRWRIATWSPWLAAGGGLWVLATLLPAGWASRPLSQADCMSICGRTPMPQAVVTALVLTRERADVATLPDRLRAIDVASARFGAATPLLIERYQTIRSMLVSGRASGGPWGGLAVGDLPDALAETGQCLVRSNPFLIQPYFDLLSMPKHRVVIDPVLQRRLEILRQVPEGAPARPPMPGGIDDLADTWLHLVSRRVHGRADAWDDGQEMEIRRRLPWIPKVSDAAGILRAMAVHPGERQAGGTVR